MFAINKTLTMFAEHKHTNSNQMNTIAQRPISHKEELQMLGIALYSRSASFGDSVDTNPELIIDLVSRDYNVSREQLIEVNRNHPFPQIRHVLMWYFHKELGLTQYEAGGYFEGSGKSGRKDHATVVHACRLMLSLEKDRLLSYHFHRIMEILDVDTYNTHKNNIEDRILNDLRIYCGSQEMIISSHSITQFTKNYSIERKLINKVINKAVDTKVAKFGLSKAGRKTIQFI